MTNFLFGGGTKRVNNSQPPATGLRVQSSIEGKPIPLGWGQNRIAGNIIDYDDFAAIPHESSPAGGGGKGGGGSGGGGKGGGSGATTYTYQANFLIGLAEGTIANVLTVWNNKTAYAPASLNIGSFSGSYTQAAWSTWASLHPSKALAYRGLAYAVSAPFDLGNNTEMPNLSFEVAFGINDAISGFPDADPSRVLADYLTNPHYGIGFPSANLGDLSLYSDYCIATGLIVSPILTDQQEGRQFLKDLLTATNSEAVWSAGLLTIVPYGDTNITANGVTYTAPVTPIYSLGDDDFKPPQGSNPNSSGAASSNDPVQATRLRPSDQMNAIKIEYLDRSNAYNPTVVEAKDDATIQAYGLRASDTKQLHFFCLQSAALLSAQLQLGRQAVRTTYTVTVGQEYILLDPMDIIEITDAQLGLNNQTVRITEITENQDGTLTMTAEDFLTGSGTAPLYGAEVNAGTVPDYNQSAGALNPPVIFEPPDELAGALEVWVGLSGSSSRYGGTDLYLSTDGETYTIQPRQVGIARMGTLTAALQAVAPASTGPTVDQTNTLSVDVSESNAQLLSVEQPAALALNTLCYVDGELIAYETATLTGTGKYDLKYLVRDVYGSGGANGLTHAAGSSFLRLDTGIYRIPFTADRIGQTIYLKALPFNIWGGGQPQLADVPVYTYRIQGSALASPLPDVQNLRSVYVGNLTSILWDEVSDFRSVMYEVRQGASASGGQVLGRVAHPPFTAPGDGTYWIAAVSQPTSGLTVYSEAWQSITISGATLNRNIVKTWEEDPGWSGSTSGAAALSGGEIVLGSSGNLLAVADYLGTANILNIGTFVGTGTYTIPAAHQIDVGRVAPCLVTVTYSSIGQIQPGADLLSAGDFLGITDFLGNAASANVDVYPQIQTSQDGVTFGAWQDYEPGIYNARKFNLRMQLESRDAQTEAILESMGFTVDAPDRIDDYVGVALAAGGTAITYTPNGSGTAAPFNGGPGGASLPQVQVEILGAVAGDLVVISAQSLSGATFQVTNGGVGVARSVNILVKGY